MCKEVILSSVCRIQESLKNLHIVFFFSFYLFSTQLLITKDTIITLMIRMYDNVRKKAFRPTPSVTSLKCRPGHPGFNYICTIRSMYLRICIKFKLDRLNYLYASQPRCGGMIFINRGGGFPPPRPLNN